MRSAVGISCLFQAGEDVKRDYYRARWQKYFESLDAELGTGIRGAPIDWFALGDAWNRSKKPYSDRPRGDAYVIAQRIAMALN